MKSLRSLLLPSLALTLGAVTLGVFSSRLLVAQQNAPPASKAAPTGPQGKVDAITVHGKSLEGNLEGDSPDRPVFVYLPPSYSANTTRRYPVVYMLHGYGLTGERWMSFANIAAAADKDIAAGTMKEMIVVNPDAYTLYNGSMFSTSTTTGDWLAFIGEDLVGYIDSHYRTTPERMSRGLAGHSMGGYGTLKVAMKYSQVFGSIYPMSACCLNAQMTPNPQQLAAFDAFKTPEEIKTAAQAKGKGKDDKGKGKGGGVALTTPASAAAWSPNPQNPPFFFDLPAKDGQVRPEIVAKWVANAPLAMVDQYVTQFKSFHAFQIEVGLQDTLLRTNQQLDAMFTLQGVPHTFQTYEGDHTNRVPQRIEENVLPFFSRNLTFK